MDEGTGTDTDALDRAEEWARHQHHCYAEDEDRPLGSYTAIAAVYSGAVLGAGAVARATGTTLPRRFRLRDLALLAIGTHKAARLLAKDPVTSPLRAPFARFAGQGGPSEVHEEVRGIGVRHAVGELVTCPFCMGQWVATTSMFGLLFAPTQTRFIASMLAVLAGSDFLQLGYAAAQPKSG